MEEKEKSLVVADRKLKEARLFARMSYESHLSLLTNKSDKEFKRVFKKAERVMKRKTKEIIKAERPRTILNLFSYLGASFVLPVLLGGVVGIAFGIFSDVASVFEMVKTTKIGDISPMFSGMIQGAISMAIVRVFIEIVKLPWKKLGFDKGAQGNKFIGVVNSIVNFFPNIISQLAPVKEKETVEDYIKILENDPNASEFIRDPTIKAKLFTLRFIDAYEVEKPKTYNYKALHAIKGAVKYLIVGGALSLVNPVESVLPIRVFVVTLAGAITEFILKRFVDQSIIRDTQQKNADYKLVLKKMDVDQKNRLVGYLASRWFDLQPEPGAPIVSLPEPELETDSEIQSEPEPTTESDLKPESEPSHDGAGSDGD